MLRRTFLKTAAGAAGLLASRSFFAEGNDQGPRLHVALNQFTVNNIYRRDGVDFMERLDELKSLGVDGLEPTAGTAAELESVGKKLKDHGLQLRSIYTGGNFFDEQAAPNEAARIRALAEKAKEFGTKIIVLNPNPKSGKSDAELAAQSRNIDKLGEELAKIGIVFAMHYHTTELEFGGREFHHLLCGTDPKNFSLCLEQHWSYRASGNSQIALFDHLRLYGDRVAEVHLRQSIDNVWSETYGDGDIDNAKLSAGLKMLKNRPHFVLEQAAEQGTP